MMRLISREAGTKLRYVLLSCLMVLAACGSGQNSKASKTAVQYPAAETPSAKLYVQKCSQCHVAPLPSAHVAVVWPSIVQRMQIHMSQQGKAALSKSDLAMIFDYLQANAKR